jgi:primosomal protein N' (replication factor Y)
MDKKLQKFVLDVVPLTKIPLNREQFFWYLADKNLTPGTLVNVPLFKRKVEGIVIRSRPDFKRSGNIELKKIDSVIKESFLTEPQLRLAKFISDHYISPLGIVLKSFIPKRVKSRNKKNPVQVGDIEPTISIPSPQPSPEYRRGGIVLTPEQKMAVGEISDASRFTLHASRFLLFGPSGSGKTEVYIHSILESVARNAKREAYKEKRKTQNVKLQFLILVPEKTLTPQAIERYGAYFKSEETVVLSSNITKGKYWESWQKIESGEAKIIIGTRMAVFAPFRKLGLIVIDEEQDVSYKQWDMNPRYDARTVAEKLAEIHKCAIVRGSATPSVESYWRAQNKDLQLLEIPALELKEARSKNKEERINNDEYDHKNLHASCFMLHASRSILVDMKKERWKKNISCISKKLQAEIAFVLKHNLQAILFINRQGMGNFSVCKTCKTVIKCPNCDRALIPDKDGYACPSCSRKISAFAKCEKCGGVDFRNVGLGTQKVEREVGALFPQARIIVTDSRNAKALYQKELYEKFSGHKADILIGTQIISKGWDLPRVALIGIIDADNLLNFPDFTANVKAFQNIMQVAGRTGRPGSITSGSVIIQTYDPENKILKLAAERNYVQFWKQEIEERKTLGYPPFSKLINLIFQDFSRKKVEEECSRVFRLIGSMKEIKVFEPGDPSASKIRGRFRRQIVIKIRDKMPSGLTEALKNLPAGWIIDVEPIAIM